MFFSKVQQQLPLFHAHSHVWPVSSDPLSPYETTHDPQTVSLTWLWAQILWLCIHMSTWQDSTKTGPCTLGLRGWLKTTVAVRHVMAAALSLRQQECVCLLLNVLQAERRDFEDLGSHDLRYYFLFFLFCLLNYATWEEEYSRLFSWTIFATRV